MDENKIKSWIAPDIDTRTRRLNTFKQYAFYGIIAIILVIVLFIVPLLSGGINANDFGYYLPKTIRGWIVFWAIRGGTVAGNMCVYGLFKAQAKTNAKDNPNFIKANEILNKLYGTKQFIPHSPAQKSVRDWTIKGIVVLLTTADESIVIGSLIFNWDNNTSKHPYNQNINTRAWDSIVCDSLATSPRLHCKIPFSSLTSPYQPLQH